jgi:acetyltransferase-like isoleucine patch superfamily enzyme
MADIVIFGAGDAAQLMKFYLEWCGEHRVVGFTVDADRLGAKTFEKLPLVAWEDLEKHFPPAAVQLFAPISYAKLNTVRQQRFLDGRARGYRFISFIHPKATYYGTPVGENCLILEASYIHPFSEIGDNVMVWGGVVSHHTRIADHCFLTSAIVMANTTLGPRCFVSFSDVIDGVTIGEACVIARRAYVTTSLPPNTVVIGPPSVTLKIPSHRLRGV